MPVANLKSYLQLHLIVFIWGFSGILGELISIPGDELVWYRMSMAAAFLYIWIRYKKMPMLLPWKAVVKLILVGFLIGIHWILFFTAIDISNVSITLAMFSVGAFFAAILEPIFYGRKMLWYEVFFGLIIIACLSLIMQVEFDYLNGMIMALVSVFFGVLFTLMNGKLIASYKPEVITFYEFIAGFALVSVYLFFKGSFDAEFFQLSSTDWFYLFLLSSVCGAFAFTASVDVMKKLSPYTVMLTTNLEPVYGIFLAFIIIGDSEKMSWGFYVAAAVIVSVVIANGWVKHRFEKKKSTEIPDTTD